jgi:phosphoribosylaminoimidazolecarboxamide formyltransferase/IMP cyclohydrolase
MDGRVKTLHPRVHGGLLGRRGVDDAVMAKHDIPRIDLLVVNLYPFAADRREAGLHLRRRHREHRHRRPAMVRAASKNHESVTVIVDPADYARVAGDSRPTPAPPASIRAHGSPPRRSRIPRNTTRWCRNTCCA